MSVVNMWVNVVEAHQLFASTPYKSTLRTAESFPSKHMCFAPSIDRMAMHTINKLPSLQGQ